jgi:carboxyl-terminal processing protease
LIQTPYHGGNVHDYLAHKFDGGYVVDIDSLPDSLRFMTSSGRIVPGGGGIYPDRVVAPDSTSILLHPLTQAVLGPNLDIVFIRDLFDREQAQWDKQWGSRESEFVTDFKIDQSLMNRFWEFAADRGVRVAPGSLTPQQKAEAEPAIRAFLRGRIAQKLYGSEAWYPAIRAFDNDLNVALTLWPEAEALAAEHGWTR